MLVISLYGYLLHPLLIASYALLSHEQVLTESPRAVESSVESQSGWSDDVNLAMDQIHQILNPNKITETKKTTRTKRSAL